MSQDSVVAVASVSVGRTGRQSIGVRATRGTFSNGMCVTVTMYSTFIRAGRLVFRWAKRGSVIKISYQCTVHSLFVCGSTLWWPEEGLQG